MEPMDRSTTNIRRGATHPALGLISHRGELGLIAAVELSDRDGEAVP
jgi:hypothetical protein